MADHFTILHVDLATGRGERKAFSGPGRCLGGAGLAAELYDAFGLPFEPAFHPAQPLIFAVGPLTGYFPLMSKAVCAFRSPYNGQYTESYAGGRLALSLRFAGLDALVLTGAAPTLSALVVGPRRLEMHDVHYLAGRDIFATGRHLRRVGGDASGHRSIMRIGPAGENLVAYACVNVDTYRHFGRLGAGAVMGAKGLKGIVVNGTSPAPIPQGPAYPKLFKAIHKDLTGTDMMSKYHDLGTAENLLVLNELSCLPWRNLQQTKRPEIDGISGEAFAEDLLLRQTACSGCPVGCIHIGLLRERFAKEHEYLYRQVSYDYEPIFSCGSMLGLGKASEVLAVMDECERQGLDVLSAGVALAWAAEATEKGLLGEAQTIVPLRFGQAEGFREAMAHLGAQSNDFYMALGKGALVAAARFGGEDFACVLGQEMAGYATGEVYTVSQALGFRHSHLDAGAYSYDMKAPGKDADQGKDPAKAVAFMVQDERARVMLSCMTGCLFSRKVYNEDRLAEALAAVGLPGPAQDLDALAGHVQAHRWRLKFQTGYDPDRVRIPKRYLEVVTWKGPMDEQYMLDLRKGYATAIRGLAQKAPTAPAPQEAPGH